MVSDILITRTDNHTTIRIKGRLDYSQMRKEDEVISAVASSDSVIIDFSECDFLDSSGLGFLLIVKKAIKDQGVLRFTGCNDFVKECLARVGFDKMFVIE